MAEKEVVELIKPNHALNDTCTDLYQTDLGANLKSKMAIIVWWRISDFFLN